MMPDCKLDVTGDPVIASSALFPDWSKNKSLTPQAACGRMSVKMKTELIQIGLTAAQVDSADWLLGCPLFDEDAESLAHNWDETPERAAAIVAAAKQVKRDGRTLTLPNDHEVIEYLHQYAKQLADMSGSEYLDELVSKGVPHREAQCKVNAAVRSAESLADKIASHL
jgi:hypothetical protein